MVTDIEVPVWWKPGGGMMYNRDCLPPEHPESTYNYIKNALKLKPEEYGVYMGENRIKDRVCCAIAETRGKDKAIEWRAACDQIMEEVRRIFEDEEQVTQADKERWGQ